MGRKVIYLDDSYTTNFIEQTFQDCVIVNGGIPMIYGMNSYIFRSCKFVNCIIKDISDLHFKSCECEFVDCKIISKESTDLSFYDCKFIDSSLILNEYNACCFFDCEFNKSKIVSITEDYHERSTYVRILRCVFDDECTCDVNGNNFDYLFIAETKTPNDFLPMACPKSGEFIGYKKCYNLSYTDDNVLTYRTYVPYVVALLIPADAKRSSGTGRKCRCSKAKVIGIYDLDGFKADVDTVRSMTVHYDAINYKKGNWVYPDSFDEDRFNECSHGIHFFMTFDEAAKYLF